MGNTYSHDVEYKYIDYAKLCCAILVVAIHTSLIYSVENEYIRFVVEYLESLAVPFFFCTTGFLLQEKMDIWIYREKEVLKKAIYKYIKLYLFMSLIYFPLTIFNILTKQDESFVRILLKMVRNYTFVGEQFYSWQLWYLLSSVLGITVLYFLYKNNKVVGNIDLLKYAVLSFSLAYIINQYCDFKIF